MANKRQKCKNCGQHGDVNDMIKLGLSYFCTIDHAIQYTIALANKSRDRLAKKEVKKKLNAKKAVNKAFDKKVKDNDLGYQLGLTQPVFNELVRLQEFKWFADRGLEPECISCGKQNMDWCCGHFKTVGSQGALRFDFVNVNLQCNKYCNQSLSGNINGNKTTRGYLQGLHDRFGEFVANEIIAYCEKDRIAEWDCAELIKMRKRFRAEIRELKLIT